MCVAMEEKTKNAIRQPFEPVEIKVVEISGQSRICTISQNSEAEDVKEVVKVYNF